MTERLAVATESWRPQRRASIFDPQIRRMALIAGGAAAVLGVGVAGYSLIAHRPHGVPVIEADSRPLRVKPDNPGGMQVAGAEEQIMGGSGGSQADAMAPAPEAPQPQVLRAQIQAARQDTSAQPVVPPAQPVLPPPPPAPAATISAAPEQRAAAAAAVRPPLPHPAGAPTVGGTEVQLAAVDSEQAAMTEWHRLSTRMPDLMAARHPAVVKAERDGKTFYRLRTGGFTDIAQATAFCTQVKSKGGGCAIASF